MNLTDDKEMRLIKEISDRLGRESMESDPDNPYRKIETEDIKSYFRKRDVQDNSIENLIRPYMFKDANEIKAELNRLWEKNPERQEYILPLTVAALKHKRKGQEVKSVSQYIYEF